MVEKLYIYESDSFDPYYNLATEKHLLENIPENSCTLYLWQNENTVVIGCNQNPWSECRLSLLEQDQGKLARRLSGGGAVFHDKGNLNFTFLMSNDNYDLDKQFSVIETACSYAGISTERSGRNDLLASGCKFSGNAFYHKQGKSYHHGTLLIHADMEKLSRYLTPSKAKLAAKGVASVRSRVVNLQELSPALTCCEMKKNMIRAFESVYGQNATVAPIPTPTPEQVAHMQDYDWLYGRRLPVSFSCEDRFSWGGVQIQLQAEAGTILDAKVYTDSMDWSFAGILENALVGCSFRLTDMLQAIENTTIDSSQIQEISQLLKDQMV